MDNRTTVNLYVLLFSAFAIWLRFYTDAVASYMVSAPLPLAILVNLATNPAYILIIISAISWQRSQKFRAFIAGMLIVIASDIIGFARLSPTNFNPADLSTMTNIDALFAQTLTAYISYSAFQTLYYVILPIFLVFVAARILGYAKFVKKIRGMGSA